MSATTRREVTSDAPAPRALARRALVPVLVYAVVAALWILLSDHAVALFYQEPEAIRIASTLKGWLFVAATSLMLYLLIKGQLRQVVALEAVRNRETRANARTRRLLEEILDGSSDAIFAKDIDGRYQLFNREVARVVGQVPEEVLGCDDRRLFVDEQAKVIRTNDQRVMNENRVVTCEETISTVDGERTYLSTKGPLHDLDGQVNGMFGISRDITERKQAERELELHRHHLEKLVAARTRELSRTASQLMDTQFAMNSVGIAIHWVDAENGRFLYVNRIAAEMLGYTVDEMLTMSVPDIDPNFSIEHFKAVSGRFRSEGHSHFETLNRTRNGAVLPVEVSLHYLEARDGERPRFIVFVTDISARKEAELALLQAKESAEAATRSKSAFLANMSHEIRTPLNGILGLAHLLGREGATPRQLEFLDKITASGKLLLGVINDILDLSKIDAGKLQLEQRDFLLDELVDGVLAVTGEAVTARNLSLVVDMAGVPQLLRGDPTRIAQVLVNFLSNAVKFTERGSITLRGRLLDRAESGYRVRFEVIDTGIGIPSEQQGRLFEAFEQADSSTTRKYGGTGLGLAINRRIIELFGGEIGVDSMPGQGSTFWFTLRLGRGSASGDGATGAPHQLAEARLQSDFRGTRVLVAEDNPINQQVTLMVLEGCGLAPELAEDGRRAVAMAQASDYALILMDMQMPEMDGIEATRAIRALPGYAEVPILAMTANAYEDDQQRCLAAGMNDFISKPVDPERLHETLLHWLSQPA